MADPAEILGPFETRFDGDVVGVPAGKQRALLTLLAVRAPHPVSADSAAEALWPRAAPAEAMRSLQVTVSRLRRSLGAAGSALETVASGYRLAVQADAIDALRFEQLAADGYRELEDGEPERAARALRAALSLWRGPALADLAFETFAQAEIGRLEEERLAALEARVGADLAVGRSGELAGELQQLVALHPLRERLHGQLMLALYRSGRQADALQAYRDARDVLVEQLGIEPGPELRELERAILAHDPLLNPKPRVREAVPGDERATAARIPALPTATIGREADLARLQDLLGERACRLLTLVGPGGVGKTRLALELARGGGERFVDSTYFVTLAPLSRHEDVASTIVQQLDVVLLPSESAEDGLARHVGEREVLLVLDNFEHVLDAAPFVADLLAATSRLTVLVTSRAPLHLRAERLFRLDPLGLPAVDRDSASLAQAPAVALFVAVARARDPSFSLSEDIAPSVARVCRRLDGLPLAIELAAARIGLLTVPELMDRLGAGLEALGTASRDAPARQRTLTATLEWSYRLLTPDEQAALASLAVFAGGCTLDAAQAVTGAPLDVLEALVEKNLVVRRPLSNGHRRLALLETVGDFARGRLDQRRDGADLLQRHFDYYLALARRAAPELERSDAPALMTELDREVNNLRAALAWALDQHAAPRALEFATATARYWELRDPREGARWLRDALALEHEDLPVSVRAAALGAYAALLDEARTFDEAEAAANESLELARSIGDDAQCAASMTALAFALLSVDRIEEGHRYATEAERLARKAHDEVKRASALHAMAVTALTFDEALTLGAQAAAALRGAGPNRALALLQTSLTYIALTHGDHDAAQRLTPEALHSAQTLGDPFALSFASGNEGLVTLLTGDAARASELFTRELQLANQYQFDLMLYEAISGLAGVAAARGEDELAARLTGAAETTGPERHHPALAQQLEDRFFAPARTRLGEQAWQSAYAAGAALTQGQAVEAALDAHKVISPAGG